MKLRRLNHVLTVVVILLAGYLIYQPVALSTGWWVKHEAPLISKPATVPIPEQPPTENTLIIPSIGLQQPINEGASKVVLRKGVWHRPNTSSPDAGSNTVLAGHRFTYTDPAVFYHLDKVKMGDSIVLFWNQKKYTYTVSAINTVAPTAVDVEDPTDMPTLTVYTCTPLWSSSKRLVVVAKLEATT